MSGSQAGNDTTVPHAEHLPERAAFPMNTSRLPHCGQEIPTVFILVLTRCSRQLAEESRNPPTQMGADYTTKLPYLSSPFSAFFMSCSPSHTSGGAFRNGTTPKSYSTTRVCGNDVGPSDGGFHQPWKRYSDPMHEIAVSNGIRWYL